MARSTTSSNRTTRNTSSRTRKAVVATPVERDSSERVVRRTRSLTNYKFEYARDRVSRTAGSSYLRINSSDGDTQLEMSLQEARSLYNFLNSAINSSQD